MHNLPHFGNIKTFTEDLKNITKGLKLNDTKRNSKKKMATS